MRKANIGIKLPRAKIGLLATGHKIYWNQFSGLREKCLEMLDKFREKLEKEGDVIMPELTDTAQKSFASGELFAKEKPDIVIIFPMGYTTGMEMIPAVRSLSVPIRILNAHLDASYDYKNADTAEYLYHEGVCCVPEYSSALMQIGKKFKIISGHFSDDRMWKEIRDDCMGAVSARVFKESNFGLIGNTYTGMTDMPTDESKLLRATGRLFIRPEIEEIEESYKRVGEPAIKEMLRQFRLMYDVEKSVTDEHLWDSAQIAVAYDEIKRKYDLGAFGYYWWGEKNIITRLRSQSALAVSRLSSTGCPGVTEGDVKTAMGMKILDLIGADGMFIEFFCMDFKENCLLIGHDGPSNVRMAQGRARLKHLDIHHGKTGSGIGIDFEMKKGPATLLNFTQDCKGSTFKLIYTTGEIIGGPVLNIGNPNFRFKTEKTISAFFDEWCQQGPVHHSAVGYGDVSRALECYADAMDFPIIRV